MNTQISGRVSPILIVALVFAIAAAGSLVFWRSRYSGNTSLASPTSAPIDRTAWHRLVLASGNKLIGNILSKDTQNITLGNIYQYVLPDPRDEPVPPTYLRKLTASLDGPGERLIINRENITSDTVLMNSDPAITEIHSLQKESGKNTPTLSASDYSDWYSVFLLNPLPGNPTIKTYFGKIVSSSADQLIINRTYYIVPILVSAAHPGGGVSLQKTGQGKDSLNDLIKIDRKDVVGMERLAKSGYSYDALQAAEQK